MIQSVRMSSELADRQETVDKMQQSLGNLTADQKALRESLLEYATENAQEGIQQFDVLSTQVREELATVRDELNTALSTARVEQVSAG